MEIGFQLLGSLIAGWFLGMWLGGNRWWAGMLGGFIGFVGVMFQMYKRSMADIETAKQARHARDTQNKEKVEGKDIQ